MCKESNQRNTPRKPRRLRRCARSGRGSLDGHPAHSRTRAHPARDPTGGSGLTPPRLTGPKSQSFCAQDARALLFPGSPWPCGGSGRKGPAGVGARDRADSAVRPGMACQPNPSARSEPLAQRAARRRGCRFLWLLSFGQAKESDRPPWMADENTHGRESVIATTPHTNQAA